MQKLSQGEVNKVMVLTNTCFAQTIPTFLACKRMRVRSSVIAHHTHILLSTSSGQPLRGLLTVHPLLKGQERLAWTLIKIIYFSNNL